MKYKNNTTKLNYLANVNFNINVFTTQNKIVAPVLKQFQIHFLRHLTITYNTIDHNVCS